MNIGQLKSVTSAYLQQPEEEYVVGGVDLLLVALNNARKAAELIHDWNCQEITLSVTAVDGLGSWVSGTIDEENVRMKQPETFYIYHESTDTRVPCHHHSRKRGAVKARDVMAARGLDNSFRYGDDIGYNGFYTARGSNDYRYEFYLSSGNFEIVPKPTGNTTVLIEGYRWLPAYTLNEDTDFFTEEGPEYLQWASIVELNYLVQTFVPQQSGNLSPPEKAKNEALAKLIEHDNFIVQGGRQP